MVNDRKHLEELERKLDRLLAEYRSSLPDPEPSANFMPELWQKIEASQTFVVSFRRWAQRFVTVAAAICLLMGLYLAAPHRQPVYTATYLDVLVADNSPERLAYAEVHHELGDRNPQ